MLGMVGAAWRRRERMRANPDGLGQIADVPLRLGFALAVLFAVMLAAISMPACGGGGTGGNVQTGTPAGTYTLDVKGTVTSGSATTTHDIKLTLTVN